VISTACALAANFTSLHLHSGSGEIARRAYFTRSKTYVGRVIRDIGRRIAGDDALEELFARELSVARRVLAQDR
jgi:transposase, IS5 family